MNYAKKIKNYQDAIAVLREKQQNELNANAPNIIGKCFRLAYSTYILVKEAYKIDEDKEYDATGIVVTIAIDEKNASIQTDNGQIISIDEEISHDDFEQKLRKALDIISANIKVSKYI